MAVESLSFREFNKNASTTVLFLHGSFVSSHEWDLVIPHLSDYHLLVPDLPQHGPHGSASSKLSFTLSKTVELAALLINSHAHAGKAHIVGMSLGGYGALMLAAEHPQLCLSVFATGCGRRVDYGEGGSSAPLWLLNSIFAVSNKALGVLPSSVIKRFYKLSGLTISQELHDDIIAGAERKVTKNILIAMTRETGPQIWDKVVKGGVRTCVIAAEKSDPVDATRVQGEALKAGNSGSKAYVLRAMPHAWDLVDGELFGQSVAAWIQEKDMPKGFQLLQ